MKLIHGRKGDLEDEIIWLVESEREEYTIKELAQDGYLATVYNLSEWESWPTSLPTAVLRLE